MSKSLEHSQKFHMVRRLAHIVAPDFRVLARSDFHRQQSCLDLSKKTIEVSEHSTEIEMVGYALFHLGHLKLRSKSRFKEHFGEIGDDTDANALLKKLARQGAEADRNAAEWAYNVFVSNFNVAPDRAEAIISSQIWNEDEWLDYYESQDETK